MVDERIVPSVLQGEGVLALWEFDYCEFGYCNFSKPLLKICLMQFLYTIHSVNAVIFLMRFQVQKVASDKNPLYIEDCWIFDLVDMNEYNSIHSSFPPFGQHVPSCPNEVFLAPACRSLMKQRHLLISHHYHF